MQRPVQTPEDVGKMRESVHEPRQQVPVPLQGELSVHQHPLRGRVSRELSPQVRGEVYSQQRYLLCVGQGGQWAKKSKYT